MLMRASLTGGLRLPEPIGLSGMSLIAFDLALAAPLWLAVAGVLVASRRPPGETR